MASTAELPVAPLSDSQQIAEAPAKDTKSEELDWASLPYEVAAKHAYYSSKQEELWAEANVDGRAHWSVREQYRLHAMRFKLAVDDFRLSWDLVAKSARKEPLALPVPALARVLDFHSLYKDAVAYIQRIQCPAKPVVERPVDPKKP